MRGAGLWAVAQARSAHRLVARARHCPPGRPLDLLGFGSSALPMSPSRDADVLGGPERHQVLDSRIGMALDRDPRRSRGSPDGQWRARAARRRARRACATAHGRVPRRGPVQDLYGYFFGEEEKRPISIVPLLTWVGLAHRARISGHIASSPPEVTSSRVFVRTADRTSRVSAT